MNRYSSVEVRKSLHDICVRETADTHAVILTIAVERGMCSKSEADTFIDEYNVALCKMLGVEPK